MKQLLATLLIVGVLVAYFWWIAAALILIIGCKLAASAVRATRTAAVERRAQHAALAARAEEQHRWALEGDPRGTYGIYEPAVTARA